MLNFHVCFREVSLSFQRTSLVCFRKITAVYKNTVCGLCDLNVTGIIFTSQANFDKSHKKLLKT